MEISVIFKNHVDLQSGQYRFQAAETIRNGLPQSPVTGRLLSDAFVVSIEGDPDVVVPYLGETFSRNNALRDFGTFKGDYTTPDSRVFEVDSAALSLASA